MKAIKVLIVEDELIIAESIRDLLEAIGYQVTEVVRSAEEAFEAIDLDMPDIALIDIQLKGKETGIWLGEKIREQFHIPFIYLTSHGDQQTVQEAVSTLPYGYLIKPIDKQSLYATMEAALAKYGSEQKSATQQIEDGETSRRSAFIVKNALFIKDEYVYVKVPFQEILFFKASGNYIEIHTRKKKLVQKHSLKEIAELLQDQSFFQTQRSYIVNLDNIDSIGNNFLVVANHEVPLTKSSKDDLINKMRNL